MKRLALIIVLLAGAVHAQTLPVRSGEHGAFTRIVVQIPQGTPWRMGRTESGYELDMAGLSPRFDLSQVYRAIDHSRLKSIWADPDSNRLQLGIGCACHAQAELLQGQWIVIDIRNGPPPAESPAERMISGTILPPLGTSNLPRPRQRPRMAPAVAEGSSGYDWTRLNTASDPAALHETPFDAPQSQPDLQAFRKTLMETLDQAGTGGIVRFAEDAPVAPHAETAGRADNFAIGPTSPLTGTGTVCPDPAGFDLPSWASGKSAAAEMAAARAGLLGEFDRVDPVALRQAARVHLFYGFGAEARTLLANFSKDDSDRTGGFVTESALSYLVDGELPPGKPFDGLQTCPGAAALWSLAAAPPGTSLPDVNADAVAQAFMSLPAPLQRLLAADLAERLQTAGHGSQAEILLNSLMRGDPESARLAPMVEAELSLQRGQPALAEAALSRLEPQANDSRSPALRIEAAFQQRQPLPPEMLTEIEGLYFTGGRSQANADLRRALSLARAMGGDFGGAFTLAETGSTTYRDLWAYLAEAGGDSALLQQVALATQPERQGIPRPIRARIGQRLLDLGLPSLAADWVLPGDANPELAATLDLARNDGRSAIRALAGVQSATAESLRIKAFERLGSFDRAAELADRAGLPQAAIRFRRWAGDFSGPPEGRDDPWFRVAQSRGRASPGDGTPSMTLAATRALLDQTRQSRQDIAALLDQTRIE